MKIALVLCLVLATALALTKEEIEAKFKAANDKCNSEPATTVTKEDWENWRKKGSEEPANLGSHAVCMAKELGWIGDDGKVRKEALREKISHSVPEDKVNEIMDECIVDQENEVKTAKHLFRCIMRGAKAHHDSH